MRSIWKGAVSFGLVTIPISLYTATEDKDVHFNQLHKTDHSRIRYRKFCEEEDVEVTDDEIVKGYEVGKGNYVVMEDKDFEDLPVSTNHAIEIQEFVDLPEVDPIYFQKSYYLEPQEGAAKPYALLREAMERSNKVALAKVVIRNKEQLATLRIYNDVLVMDTLFYPDEIRNPEELIEGTKKASTSEKEVQMAINLIEALSGDFEPSKYKDEYREVLLERIDQKREGRPIETAHAKPSAKITDIMEALQASLTAAQKPAAPKRKTRAA
ncbi:MAG TPA: Ku protein [Chloroflexota bacterium]|nr:Ku protein [Chloroflexota bacterium]